MNKLISVSLFVIMLLIFNNLGWTSIPAIVLAIPAGILAFIWALLLIFSFIIAAIMTIKK